jgi:hypothetical protein
MTSIRTEQIIDAEMDRAGEKKRFLVQNWDGNPMNDCY